MLLRCATSLLVRRCGIASYQSYFKHAEVMLPNCSSALRIAVNKVPARLFNYSSAGSQSQVSVKSRIVGCWLLGCSGMVFGAVALGGLTRLTESGLSIVDWHLLKGMRPPVTEQDWQSEFEKYQQYPEYHFKKNAKEMTLADFKFIWSMEYLHRMWGRAIGLVYFIPAAAFWYSGWLSAPMKPRVIIMGGLLLFQGLLGWYMVKSGLDPSSNSNADIPRVSQYRLASHLTAAFVLYAMTLYSGLSHIFAQRDHSGISGIRALKMLTHTSKLAVLLTAIMGAFVAGLDAGLVYNSWPKFADDWLPSDLWIKVPSWRNLTENPAMAYVTLLSVVTTWFVGRRLRLPLRTAVALHGMMGMAWIQVSLGIATLVHYVPVWLGSLHQCGSLTLLSFVIWLSNELRRFPTPK